MPNRKRPLHRASGAGISLAPYDLPLACARGAAAPGSHKQGKVDDLTGSRRALSRGGFFFDGRHDATGTTPDAASILNGIVAESETGQLGGEFDRIPESTDGEGALAWLVGACATIVVLLGAALFDLPLLIAMVFAGGAP